MSWEGPKGIPPANEVPRAPCRPTGQDSSFVAQALARTSPESSERSKWPRNLRVTVPYPPRRPARVARRCPPHTCRRRICGSWGNTTSRCACGGRGTGWLPPPLPSSRGNPPRRGPDGSAPHVPGEDDSGRVEEDLFRLAVLHTTLPETVGEAGHEHPQTAVLEELKFNSRLHRPSGPQVRTYGRAWPPGAGGVQLAGRAGERSWSPARVAARTVPLVPALFRTTQILTPPGLRLWHSARCAVILRACCFHPFKTRPN